MKTNDLIRLSTTALIILAAALVAWLAWQHYMLSPWTRDARVRADVVRVAPDIAGRVTQVAVHDNQVVKAGDLLFKVDREPYVLAVERAHADWLAAKAKAAMARAEIASAAANLAASQTDYKMRREHAERRDALGNAVSREIRDDARSAANAAQAAVQKAKAAQQAAKANAEHSNAAVLQAKAALDNARLQLQRTEVLAPIDGTVTNLNLRSGDYTHAGQAHLALVSTDNMWLYGYFEETKLPAIQVGDAVDIRLMAGDVQLSGQVESIATGIADAASPTSENLLADVQPTFNWIRLAQRIPVRVSIDPASIPEGLTLAAGMSATLRVQPTL